MPERGTDSDEHLMAAWQGGDHEAFDVLVLRWHARLFGFLLRTCPSGQAAEDAYSETLMRLVTQRDRFDTSRRFPAWLFALARNASLDAVRKEQRRRRLRMLWRRDLEAVWAPGAPDERLLARGRGERVEVALQQLPEVHRTVALLTWHQGLTGPEVAEVTGLSHREVRDKLAYARKKLRALLEEDA